MRPSLPLRGSSPPTEMRQQSAVECHSPEGFDDLVRAARDTARVVGLTHKFYRYPARFSPQFVRAAIEHFTEPGDTVFDPFMGGGTTLVEALALGRDSVGTDISSLAAFVTRAKTLILTANEVRSLKRWGGAIKDQINIHLESRRSNEHADAGYQRHLASSSTWRLRKALEQALSSAQRLRSERLETFARCVVLRTGQWALDGRRELPSVAELRDAMAENALEMLCGARDLRAEATKHGRKAAQVVCLNRSAVGINRASSISRRSPKLILTSPPYPGVHVLYHRWQVDGRKETPAPFWIADKLDGAGASFYTLGDRHAAENWTYFQGLASVLESVAQVANPETTIIQVVAFSEPAKQLPRYLSVAEASGMVEVAPPFDSGTTDGRLWREIPNRKWHAEQLGAIPASQEVVLFHRRRS